MSHRDYHKNSLYFCLEVRGAVVKGEGGNGKQAVEIA
jgi:hypothetical protein